MKEKANTIAQIIMLLVLLTIGYFGFSNDAQAQSYVYKLAIGFGIALCLALLVWVFSNGKLVWYSFKTHLPWSYRKPIRITVAYLFRIEIDGKYLLVKNKRNIKGFQPVGGVYKYLRRENAELFDRIGLIPDTKIERDAIAEDDLRLEMKKRYRLLAFIRWFGRNKHREVDPWREFYEELVQTGILSHDNFPYIQYRFIRQHRELKYSEHHRVTEYKVADIYELQFINDEQKQEIRRLLNSGHEDVLFVRAEEIKDRRKGENEITDHTFKIV